MQKDNKKDELAKPSISTIKELVVTCNKSLLTV